MAESRVDIISGANNKPLKKPEMVFRVQREGDLLLVGAYHQNQVGSLVGRDSKPAIVKVSDLALTDEKTTYEQILEATITGLKARIDVRVEDKNSKIRALVFTADVNYMYDDCMIPSHLLNGDVLNAIVDHLIANKLANRNDLEVKVCLVSATQDVIDQVNASQASEILAFKASSGKVVLKDNLKIITVKEELNKLGKNFSFTQKKPEPAVAATVTQEPVAPAKKAVEPAAQPVGVDTQPRKVATPVMPRKKDTSSSTSQSDLWNQPTAEGDDKSSPKTDIGTPGVRLGSTTDAK